MLELTTIKDVKTAIGSLCRGRRQEYGLSQDELARELGLSRLTVQKLEKGGNVTLDTLLKALNHFGLLPEFSRLVAGLGNTGSITTSLY